MFTCDFDRHGCRHDSLFLSEYKRTNRTKGTKILRCFPHCCPEHVNRSYCGSALHVRVQSHDGTSTDDDRLLVFAHFEEVGAANTFAVGDELPAPTVFESIQTEQHPKGEWIQGLHPTRDASLSRPQDLTSQLYAISPGARWYYEWESAATKAQRFTKHVLKVYVFQPRTSRDGDSLRIVAAVSSSEFMVVSYRRAQADLSGDRRILALLAENVARQGGGELALESDALLASLGQKMLPFLTESQHAKEDKKSSASPTSLRISPSSRRVRVRLRPSSTPPSRDRFVETQRVWAASHVDTLAMAKRLAVLDTFLSALPAADFHHILSAWGVLSSFSARYAETKSEASSPGTPPPLRQPSVSWRFLSPLRVGASPNGRFLPSLRDAAGMASSSHEVYALVDQSVQALAWVALDDTNRATLTQLLHEASQALRVVDMAAVRGIYERVVSTLHGLIDRFLATRFGTSLGQLHEDIVAALFRVDSFRHLRSDLLRQLSSTAMAGFDRFVAQARQGAVEIGYRNSSYKRKRGVDSLYAWSPGQTAVSPFHGDWCFDGQQCSIVRLNSEAPSTQMFSVANAIEWMRECAGVAIALDTAASCVTIRSQWSLAPDAASATASAAATATQRGMRLILDGKKRVFDAFPSGVASTIPWTGLAWGDYRAQLISADCLMLEFSAWPLVAASDYGSDTGTGGSDYGSPRPPQASTALRVKLCLRVVPGSSHLDQYQRVWALAVDGVVEQARCHAHEDLVTLSIERRRAAVTDDMWTPVYQLKAVYSPAH